MNLPTLARAFQHRFGRPPAAIARAPGRVNLIGEHVDYCHGLVLPIAIDRATCAASGQGQDGLIRIYSANVDEYVEFNPRDVQPPREVNWAAYAKGVTAGLIAAGIDIPATNIHIDGDLPIGAGLAGSAALEIAIALSLLHAANRTIDDRALAALCRKAEHDYAQMPCGIMDQLACKMARADHALLLDCQDASIEYIPWPTEDAAILIADSGQSHQLTESPYSTRVDECRRALGYILRAFPQTKSLRNATLEQLADCESEMPPPLFRRARHVITEIARTRRAAQAIAAGDLPTLGRLMNESHESLRLDYEVSSPALDNLASALRSTPGVLGARMTGGGFGGSVAALVRRATPSVHSSRSPESGSIGVPPVRKKPHPATREIESDPAFAEIATHLQSWYDKHGITAAPPLLTTPAPGASLTRDPTPWTSKSTT